MRQMSLALLMASCFLRSRQARFVKGAPERSGVRFACSKRLRRRTQRPPMGARSTWRVRHCSVFASQCSWFQAVFLANYSDDDW